MLKHMKRWGLALAVSTTALAGTAMAEVPQEVATAVSTLKVEGSAILALVGGALITLAGVAILYKWAKAAIFN